MNEYALETEMIDYNHQTRHIASQSPVHILGRDFELRADAMQVDLATETALFIGAVEGQIDADTQLQM
jgi:lipopolysaccharide export system protein LptC